MKHIKILMIILVGIGVSAIATDVGIISYGSPPLLNGIEGEKEWLDASEIEWADKTGSIKLKQDSLYVYLNIIDRDTVHSGVDLYLDNLAGAISMLHVSSAHGQRKMSGNILGEMEFGPQKLWSSNIVENIFVDGKMKFLSPDVFEFQIDKKQLPSRMFKFMIHLKRPERWIPSAVDTLSSREWIEVELYR